MSTPIVDCHTHTSFSDGASTFEQNVADAAHARRRLADLLALGTKRTRVAVEALNIQLGRRLGEWEVMRSETNNGVLAVQTLCKDFQCAL